MAVKWVEWELGTISVRSNTICITLLSGLILHVLNCLDVRRCQLVLLHGLKFESSHFKRFVGVENKFSDLMRSRVRGLHFLCIH